MGRNRIESSGTYDFLLKTAARLINSAPILQTKSGHSSRRYNNASQQKESETIAGWFGGRVFCCFAGIETRNCLVCR